jgi:hypothetical protein
MKVADFGLSRAVASGTVGRDAKQKFPIKYVFFVVLYIFFVISINFFFKKKQIDGWLLKL